MSDVFQRAKSRQRRKRLLIVCLVLAPLLTPGLVLVWTGVKLGGRMFSQPGLLLHTQAGSAEYSKCPLCGAVRLKHANGTVEFAFKTARFDKCAHAWRNIIDAWSKPRLAAGDVLLIHKSGKYNAVRVIRKPDAGSAITFEWFHQPDRAQATFDDPGVETGVLKATGRIAFKNVDIQYESGRIWYDFYFGGVDGATVHAKDPHRIAFVGKVDVKTINASAPKWQYRTWEDGLSNPAATTTSTPVPDR